MARVITADEAIARSIAPDTIRRVADWNKDVAAAERRKSLRERDVERANRCLDQATALEAVADEVERRTGGRAHVAA